jgi:hypothetical protein
MYCLNVLYTALRKITTEVADQGYSDDEGHNTDESEDIPSFQAAQPDDAKVSRALPNPSRLFDAGSSDWLDFQAELDNQDSSLREGASFLKHALTFSYLLPQSFSGQNRVRGRFRRRAG